MNIVVVGNFNFGWDGSICDEEHIASALKDLGHEVIRVQRDMPALGWKWQPDFILLAQWDRYDDKFVSALKDYDCPLVYWAFDYQAGGQEWHERLIKEADLYLSKRIADSRYPNWQWLSQDFAPAFLAPKSGLYASSTYTWLDYLGDRPHKNIDILFTGSYLPWAEERNATLKAIDEQYKLVIHSVNAWEGYKDVRPPLMDKELPALYNRAKIVLSIDHTLEAGYWSDRNAQAMACESFVLFRYIPLSESTFHDKVIYFYSIADCLEKIDYWLNHPFERAELATRARTFAHDNLMVKNRVQDLLTIIEARL